MTAIPIHRPARRGWYRAHFRDLPDFRLLIPVQFHQQLTFAQFFDWPMAREWDQIAYIGAPRRAPERISL